MKICIVESRYSKAKKIVVIMPKMRKNIRSKKERKKLWKNCQPKMKMVLCVAVVVVVEVVFFFSFLEIKTKNNPC